MFLFGNPCFSQGGWNIGYIAIDMVSQDLIGEDVKLDFRSRYDSINTIPEFLMNFIAKEDSVTILLDGKEVELKEKRNIHSDWGFYDEQYLEYSNFNKSEIVRIYHTVIEKQTKDSILVRLYVEVYNTNNKGKVSNNLDRRYCISEWIPREVLNGVMIKK